MYGLSYNILTKLKVIKDYANKELIIPGVNGYLFKTDQEFFHLLEKITTYKNKSFERKSLIPEFFQYKTSIEKLVKLINTI